jgi:hypothetical protein
MKIILKVLLAYLDFWRRGHFQDEVEVKPSQCEEHGIFTISDFMIVQDSRYAHSPGSMIMLSGEENSSAMLPW